LNTTAGDIERYKKFVERKRKIEITAMVGPYFSLLARYKGKVSDRGDPDSFLFHYEITVLNHGHLIRGGGKIKFNYWGSLDTVRELKAGFNNFVHDALNGARCDTFEEWVAGYHCNGNPVPKSELRELRAEFNHNKRQFEKWLKLTGDFDVFEYWDRYCGDL
jgi:hypothetical protein